MTSGEPVSSSAGGARVDRTFRGIAVAAGLLVLAILALIAYTTTTKAWPAFTHQGISFVTGRNWDPNTDSFGALDFIYGTLLSATIALVLAVPASLGIALFITELAPRGWSNAVTYVVDMLAAIPSVVYGYWALAVLVSPATNFYTNIANSIGRVPGLSSLFGGSARGASFMTAGLILAVMIVPIITSLSREALITVSQDDKNGAIAMGATRIEMLRVAVFPRVRSGLIAAAMLGLGRAMGETIAVALVIGGSPKITSHLFRSGDTMASVIVHEFPEATDIHRAALIGLGVVLFAITIAVNVAARAIANRSVLVGNAAMTVIDTPAPPERGDSPDPADWILEQAVSPRRRFVNGAASAWMIGSLLFALVPVVIIAVYVISKGAGIISIDFLTKDIPIVTQNPGGGIGPAIVGTLIITGVAALMAIPLGVLAAVYLNEYGGQNGVAKVIRFMADVMTGVPSIVMGLFIATIWVSSGLHFGYSGFAGSLALAALMLPIVIRSSEEMLKLVPDDLRQASDALGARRWRTVVSVVIPAALPGIVSGAMLAVARAAGETAPLLFTIGVTTGVNLNPFHGTNTTLSQEIWFNAQTPFAAAKDRAWGAALTLIVIVFVLTVIARVVSNRFSTVRR